MWLRFLLTTINHIKAPKQMKLKIQELRLQLHWQLCGKNYSVPDSKVHVFSQHQICPFSRDFGNRKALWSQALGFDRARCNLELSCFIVTKMIPLCCTPGTVSTTSFGTHGKGIYKVEQVQWRATTIKGMDCLPQEERSRLAQYLHLKPTKISLRRWSQVLHSGHDKRHDLKQERLGFDKRKYFFKRRTVRKWSRQPIEVLQSSSLDAFCIQLQKDLEQPDLISPLKREAGQDNLQKSLVTWIIS